MMAQTISPFPSLDFPTDWKLTSNKSEEKSFTEISLSNRIVVSKIPSSVSAPSLPPRAPKISYAIAC